MKKETLIKLHKSELKILDEIDRICKKNNIKYFFMGGSLLGAVRHQGFIPWDDDIDLAMPRKDYDLFVSIAPSQLSKDFLLDDISTNPNYCLVFSKVRLKNSVFEERNYENKYNANENMGIWIDVFPLDETNHFHDRYIKFKNFKIKLKKSLYTRKAKKVLAHKSVEDYFLDALSFLLKPISMSFWNKSIVKDMKKENEKNCRYFVSYGSQYGVFKQTHLKEKVLPLSSMKFEGKEYPVPNDPDYFLKNIYGDNYMQLPPIEKQVTHNPKRIVFEDGEEIIFSGGELDEKI